MVETAACFFLYLVIEPEDINMILQLNNSEACTVDGSRIRPAKYFVDLLVPVLMQIFSLSLVTGVFP